MSLHISAVHSLLLLSSITLYACIIVYSQVEGHLGCFWFLVILSKVAINVCIGFCVNISFYLLG